MNRLFIIIISLLLTLYAGTAEAAKNKKDSEILNRMFTFQENTPVAKGTPMQVYTKHYYETYRRNALLWLIPSMYTIASGQRKFVSERYDRVTIEDGTNYKRKQQLYYTTIPHNRSTMPVLESFSRPNLHGATLYGQYVLSPLCRENRFFYQYKITPKGSGLSRIEFKPRWGDNTQLASGTMIVQTKTGRVTDIVIKGNYDGIDFYTTIKQRDKKDTLSMPKYVKTDIDFKFLGNHITSSFTTVYDCPARLPDSVSVTGNRQLISSVRPIILTKRERDVYKTYDSVHNAKPDTTLNDTIKNVSRHFLSFKGLGTDVGSYLVSSHGATKGKYDFRLSPIIEPQYISYSHSRGLSYKMKFTGDYNFTENKKLNLYSTLGYNFKIKRFFLNIPLRYIYNTKKNNYLELAWESGNRVGNSAILDELEKELGELPELESIDLDDFDDNKLSLTNYTQLTKWLRLEIGAVYHRRTAVSKADMEHYGKPDTYQSLAPSVGLHLKPWKNGPNISVNYERGIKNKVFDLDYERWETSASKKFNLPSTRIINLQTGLGFYTRKHTNIFMDFSNFCVNNLPGGWDDDWSGDFQLLDSKLYNISKYYLSSNISYDSPLLMMSFIPLIGRYVEREQIYWSGLLIEYNKPYFELGYGFTTRIFSAGLFGSFNELTPKQVGVKFTLELFRRW